MPYREVGQTGVSIRLQKLIPVSFNATAKVPIPRLNPRQYQERVLGTALRILRAAASPGPNEGFVSVQRSADLGSQIVANQTAILNWGSTARLDADARDAVEELLEKRLIRVNRRYQNGDMEYLLTSAGYQAANGPDRQQFLSIEDLVRAVNELVIGLGPIRERLRAAAIPLMTIQRDQIPPELKARFDSLMVSLGVRDRRNSVDDPVRDHLTNLDDVELQRLAMRILDLRDEYRVLNDSTNI